MNANETCTVVVAGGLNIDMEGQPLAPPRAGDSNPGRVRLSAGGVGRNIARSLSLLGLRVELLTVLGEDALAREAERGCAGIGLSHALRLSGVRTPSYLALRDERGELLLAVADMDACENLPPDAFSDSLPLLRRAGALVLDANLPAATLAWLAEHCPAPLFADPVSAAKAERLAPLLPRLGMIKPNRLEAERLTGLRVTDRASAEAAARRLLERGARRVFLSMGPDGLLAAADGAFIWQDALPVRPRSVTGAGDAMTAALVWAALRGEAPRRAARLAAAAAAIALESETAVSAALSPGAVLARAAEAAR